MPAQPTPIRLALVHSGRTQREVAAEVGIHESYLSRIANGLHVDDEPTRAAIAAALGRPVDELFPSYEAPQDAAPGPTAALDRKQAA